MTKKELNPTWKESKIKGLRASGCLVYHAKNWQESPKKNNYSIILYYVCTTVLNTFFEHKSTGGKVCKCRFDTVFL